MFNQKSVTHKKIMMSLLIATVILCSSMASLAQASTLGVWETHRYTYTIPQGHLLYHQYKHEGAISGSSRMISSTGAYAFQYIWQPPWLFTYINNIDNKAITVTWEETFYVV